METFVYEPQGVCAKRYTITVDNENDTIRNIEIAGGCPGNFQRRPCRVSNGNRLWHRSGRHEPGGGGGDFRRQGQAVG